MPTWSADGGKLAFAEGTGPFISTTAETTLDIFTMDPDGGNVSRVTKTDGVEWESDPTWSPDGRRIAYVHSRNPLSPGCGPPCDNDYDIFVMNADGTGATRLTSNRFGAFEPEWSPAGDRIVFAAWPDPPVQGFEIFTMNPDGSQVTQLTSSGLNRFPSWSPDGSRIAFMSARDKIGRP